MLLKDRTILIISFQPWGKMFISKHHYAIELARRGNRVYFLNPPDTKAPFFKTERLGQYGELYVISYNPVFRGKRFLPKMLYDGLLRLQAALIMRLGRFEPDIVWSFWPFPFTDLSVWKARLKIYFSADRTPESEDIRVGESADIIFSVSETSLEDFRGCNKPSFLLGHGLADEFVRYAESLLTRNDLTVAHERITAAFIGNLLKEYVDADVFKRIVLENPDVHFLFIGPYDRKDNNVSVSVSERGDDLIAFLKSRKNVSLIGVLTPGEMIPLLEKIDCFFIAERETDLNKDYNPHKLLEHLSTGKVVVSHYLSLYEDRKDLIRMPECRNNGSLPSIFNETVRNLHLYNRVELQRKRIEFALDRSYEKQLQRIEGLIEKSGMYI